LNDYPHSKNQTLITNTRVTHIISYE